MESLYDFSLEVTRWLQANYPHLQDLMQIISDSGRFEAFLAILPLIYWCLNKPLGKQVSYVLAISYVFNIFFKHALRTPRPFWLEPEVGLDEELTYGVPSGHAQNATVFYLFLALWFRRNWLWFIALLIVGLMALSRVYLGVHFVHDALAGLLLGALVLAGYLIWRHYFQERYRNRILGQRLLVVILVPLLLTLLYIAARLFMGEAATGFAWDSYIEAAERTSVEDMATSLGILSGMGIGFILEASRLHFVITGSAAKRILRYLVGIIVTVVIWRGLGELFPDDPLWLALPLRFLRYSLAGIWVAYYAPLTFVKVGLAERSAEPEVRLTVSDGNIMRG